MAGCRDRKSVVANVGLSIASYIKKINTKKRLMYSPFSEGGWGASSIMKVF